MNIFTLTFVMFASVPGLYGPIETPTDRGEKDVTQTIEELRMRLNGLRIDDSHLPACPVDVFDRNKQCV